MPWWLCPRRNCVRWGRTPCGRISQETCTFQEGFCSYGHFFTCPAKQIWNSASSWTDTHTHTTYKAGFIEGWRVMRKGHIFIVFKMTLHLRGHISDLQYPFGPPRFTLSYQRVVSVALCLCSSLLVPIPCASWTTLWILLPTLPAALQSSPPLLGSARKCTDLIGGPQHRWVAGPSPWEDSVVIHVLSHRTVYLFPRPGFLQIFFWHYIFLTFCWRSPNIYTVHKASVPCFIDITDKLICSPSGSFRVGYILVHNLSDG